jgi:hypothetical protein
MFSIELSALFFVGWRAEEGRARNPKEVSHEQK